VGGLIHVVHEDASLGFITFRCSFSHPIYLSHPMLTHHNAFSTHSDPDRTHMSPRCQFTRRVFEYQPLTLIRVRREAGELDSRCPQEHQVKLVQTTTLSINFDCFSLPVPNAGFRSVQFDELLSSEPSRISMEAYIRARLRLRLRCGPINHGL